MTYRSERFDPGDLAGLQKAWDIVDTLERHPLPVVSEVLSGKRYRRQLDPSAVDIYGSVDYLLQAVLEPPTPTDQERIAARTFLDDAVPLLEVVASAMPGVTSVDAGGLNGYDKTTSSYAFGTGDATTEVLTIYSPWIQATWQEAGRHCIFFCGIQPPRPKSLMENWGVIWDETSMRRGQVVFKPTPVGLKTW